MLYVSNAILLCDSHVGLPAGLDENIEARLNFLSSIGEGTKERYEPVCKGERE